MSEEISYCSGAQSTYSSVLRPVDPHPLITTEDGSAVSQWEIVGECRFVPSGRTSESLTPGVYEIRNSSQLGLFFEKIPTKTEGLVRFGDTKSDRVLKEVQTFWEREGIFRKHKLTYKRGIILYGPPGSGKSCTLQLVMEDVVSRGGVVFRFDDPYLFMDGMRLFRRIQPKTPVVVVIEDIDSIIENYNESDILNILDGVNQVDKTVFLATTNYPGKLGARIMNRPSRFDKRFRIGYPGSESRRVYFETIIGKEDIEKYNIDIDRWVRDTDEMSIAHLKELFVAVIILGDNYNQALTTLRNMKEQCEDKEDAGIGFISSEHDEDFYN